MSTPETIFSSDIDDVFVNRGNFTRILGLTGLLKTFHPPEYTCNNLPEVNHEPVNQPITSPAEMLSFLFHSTRRVTSDAKHFVDVATYWENQVFANSVRSTKTKWLEMTAQTFEKGGIAHNLQHIYHTPDGTPTAVSKADVLKSLLEHNRRVVHIDDDPRTIAYLAGIFPEIQFYLFSYAITGLMYAKTKVESFPNVTKVHNLQSILHPSLF